MTKPVWMRRPEVLLCPNVPKPLHTLAPRVVLGQTWWNQTRQAAYASTNYRCIACGVHKSRAKGKQWMEGHEWYDIDYKLGRMVYIETIPLCHYCHNYCHDGRMRSLIEQGSLSYNFYIAVISHGDEVLAEYNMVRPTYEQREAEFIRKYNNQQVADWPDWRLVVFGKEYEPRFKSYEEWCSHFGK